MTVKFFAIITTTGSRTTLRDAYQSVENQTTPAAATIIVVDSSDERAALQIKSSYPAATVVVASVGSGAKARNLGVRQALEDSTETEQCYFCFLDDDDWWDEDRLTQLTKILDGGEPHDLLTGSVIFHRADGRKQIRPRVQLKTDPVQEFENLLHRKYLANAGSYVQTSTFVVSRRLAEELPWNASLARHQDWDYFYSAAITKNFRWERVEHPLVHVRQGSIDSVSRIPRWFDSLQWISSIDDVDAGARSDFIVWQVLRNSVAARSWDGIRSCLYELCRLRRVGSVRAWMVLCAAELQFTASRISSLAHRSKWRSGRRIDASAHASDRLAALLAGELSAGHTTTVAWFNHFSIQQCLKSPLLDAARFDYVEIDGLLLKWLIRFPTRTSADLVVPRLLAMAEFSRVLLVGGQPDDVDRKRKAIDAIVGAANGNVAAAFDGFQGRPTPEQLSDVINEDGIDVVLVGLGSPIQEEYVHQIQNRVTRPCVLLTVGGFLDQVTREGYYPSWAYKARLNWLIRLYREPGRLWRRYSAHAAVAIVRRKRLADFVRRVSRYDPSVQGMRLISKDEVG